MATVEYLVVAGGGGGGGGSNMEVVVVWWTETNLPGVQTVVVLLTGSPFPTLQVEMEVVFTL